MATPAPRSAILGGRRLWVLAALAAVALAAAARADDSPWPRQFDSSSGSFVIYEPQPEDLTGDLLSARAAFSLQRNANSEPVFGVLWFTERILIDRDSSTVNARNLDVTLVRLPGITAAEASQYERLVESEAQRWDLSASLEELQAGLAASEKERASVAGLDTLPPKIVFSYHRAILVAYDGPPMLEPIPGTALARVANTPYAVVFDSLTARYFLNGANVWYTAKDPAGPWTDIPAPPPEVADVVPPDTSAQDQLSGPPPLVLTATTPTELISIDGQPKYAPLVGDELLYVTNTECDVVREVSTQDLYVLLAGRWYRAKKPDGPWSFVSPDQLPESFGKVPPDSPKGNILASVAGTDQAADAVADAEIPQTSALKRGDSDFEVGWDGEPQWAPVEGTDLQYALNADAQVILDDGRYFACDQGAWYVSDSPFGPWSVSDTRPAGVDDIQPDCPVYNTRYVYVYDSTPDVVYVGYLPGYLGCYPYHGTVVYGTGYHYQPWRHRRYYARPLTWGFNPRYNPWLSRWSFGLSYGSGFLRVGFRWRSGTSAGHFHAPPMWFGPGGFRRPLVGKDLALVRTHRPRRTLPQAGDRTPANLYRRPENLARVDRAAVRLPVRRVGVLPVRVPTQPNNVFAGKDGRVYQRDPKGDWSVNNGHTWVSTRLVQRQAQAPQQPRNVQIAPTPARGGSFPPRVRTQPVTVPVTPAPATPTPAPAPSPSRPAPTSPSTPAAPVAPRGGPAAAPRVQPRVVPVEPRPAPPQVSPTPGDLEREFKSRERVAPEVRQPESRPAEERPTEAKPAPTKPAEEKPRPAPRPEPKPRGSGEGK